jgi:hypothetical protein
MSVVFPTGMGMSGLRKGIGGEAGSVTPGGNDFDFMLAVSGDEKLRRGTDARWKLDRGEAVHAMWIDIQNVIYCIYMDGDYCDQLLVFRRHSVVYEFNTSFI